MADDEGDVLRVTPVHDTATRVSMDDLKQLAIDIFDGKVFTTFSMPETAMTLLPLIFLPLALMKQEDRQTLANWEVAFFYEYYDKAGPAAVNGYPTFFSVRYLLPDEEDILIEYLRTIDVAMTKFRAAVAAYPDPNGRMS